MNKVKLVTYWLWEILKLHFNWMIYILRGGVVLGIFPSTAAVYAVARHWLINDDKAEIKILFKKYYSENFKVANLLGWISLLFSITLYLNWRILPLLDQPILKTFMYGFVIFLTILIGCFWLYLFPIIVNYSLRWFDYILVEINIAISNISFTILQIVLIGIYVILAANYIPLFILFGLCMIAIIQMYICTYVFKIRSESQEFNTSNQKET